MLDLVLEELKEIRMQLRKAQIKSRKWLPVCSALGGIAVLS
jgi:hypothetical protein